ncbi:MAG: hypothetical protein CL610_02185 [Anaerolineaceae bacterium]|nr:hypothetical protein [Anaerolineaceae bacterium]
MKLNQAAVKHAKKLIKDGKVAKDTDWSDDQPSADEENKFLDNHDWDTYGQWYLGIDTDENEETKGRHNFPYGDFKKVHRDGIIAAKQRAAQYDYADIEKAADELLEMIDSGQ